MALIFIDEREITAEEGMTVLEAARENDIPIPTLCFHPALKPSGSCKLCSVEVEGKSGKPIAMLACILKIKDGLSVKTSGELVDQARVKAFHKLLQMAPQSRQIRELADAYGVDLGSPPDGCIRCRLCIRVCKEVVGPGALHMEKHGGDNRVTSVEGRCIGCGTCANLCPTGAIRMKDQENVRSISIRGEVISRHPLQRCEGCGKMYATPQFLQHLEQRVSDHPDVKIHHRYCPTCAKLFSDRVRSMQKGAAWLPPHR